MSERDRDDEGLAMRAVRARQAARHDNRPMSGQMTTATRDIDFLLRRVDHFSDFPTGQPDGDMHLYAAAGYLVCGRQTGGNLSRAEGYEGPAHRPTHIDAHVTCPDCRAWMDEAALAESEEAAEQGVAYGTPYRVARDQ